MRWTLPASLLVMLTLIACVEHQPRSNTIVLQHLWSVSGVFQSAESVIYDAACDCLYVSNVNGYSKNGEGYLSRLSLTGELLEQHWVDGLNGPTGMAIDGKTLYVADIDEVVAIDLGTGRIDQRYPAPDDNPGLNDISINPDGRLFVSGSFSQAIYELTAEGLQPWLVSDSLRDANGLYAGQQNVMVAGYWLHAAELADKRLVKLSQSDELMDLESIETDGRGGYFITAIGARPLLHKVDGEAPRAILQPNRFFSGIEYINERQMLLVPVGGDSLSVYRVIFPAN